MTEPADRPEDDPAWGLTRRHFLGSTAALAAGAALLAGCSGETGTPVGIIAPRSNLNRPFADVPGPPAGALDDAARVLSPQEVRTLDALVGTILPGTPEDPGAREAGVVAYVDHKLASVPSGLPDRHYSRAPHAKEVPAGQPVPPSTGETLYVPEDVLPRYGPQSSLDHREQYHRGLASLDAFSTSSFGAPFADLAEQQQEAVVDALATDDATGFDQPGAQDFFNLVRGDVVEGMFGDPAYGGNRGMAGWALVGYPGAQRGYTPDDVRGLTPEKAPQSLLDMPRFHSGRPDGSNVVLPVSGSRGGQESHHHQGR